MDRIAGIDIGEKTIGVAVSDSLGITAQGIKTIRRKDLDHDLQELNSIIDNYEVELIVIGLPKNLNGSYGPSAEKSLQLGSVIKEKLQCPVTYWDERLSTMSAEKTLIESDVSRKKRKKVIDKLAAVIILQNYLDYRSQTDK